MDDIESLTTYGFRGEALSSLCEVANLTIVSRTEAELAATRTVFRADGEVETRTSCARMPGVTVTADNLFCRLPVRRNYYKSSNRRREELDKVRRMVQAFAIVCSDVRFSLHHDKTCVWSTPGCNDMQDTVALVIGMKGSKGLAKFIYNLDPPTGDLLDKESELVVSGLLPVIAPGVETSLARHDKNNTWVFINKRPVEFKEAEKMLKETFMSACRLEITKFPICVVSINIGGNMRENVDPNLEPNKHKVGLACKQVVLAGLSNILNKHWGTETDEQEASQEKENINLNGKAPSEDSNRIELESEGDDETVVKEPLFNHVGLTQNNSQATSRISADKFIENKYGLTQYFEEHGKSKSLSKGVETDQHGYQESQVKSHSPVLKPEMFDEPELPGPDAVYVSRLREGDFPEVPDEELQDVGEGEDPGVQQSNPYIQFECEEEQDSAEASKFDLSTKKIHSRSDTFPILKLKQPQFGKILKSTPTKRKREDNSLIKIDNFLTRTNETNVEYERDESTFPAPRERKRKKFLPRKRINVTFNMDKCAAPVLDLVPDDNLKVVGSLQTGADPAWIVKLGPELLYLDPSSLREIILSERLMRAHKMPAEMLPDPVSLSTSLLSPELIQTVLQMSTNQDDIVTDDRVTLNGFLISACVNQDSKSARILLQASCHLIEDYGIDDLVGIISSVHENKNISVSESRPTKVREYLSKQTKRLAQEMPSTFDKESIDHQLQSWKELSGNQLKTDSNAFHLLWRSAHDCR